MNKQVIIQMDLNKLGICVFFCEEHLVDEESFHAQIRRQMTGVQETYSLWADADLEKMILEVIATHPFNKDDYR